MAVVINLAVGLTGLFLLLFAKGFLIWLRDMLGGPSRLRRGLALPFYEDGLRVMGAALTIGALFVLFVQLRS
jgi:hypothetical protein